MSLLTYSQDSTLIPDKVVLNQGDTLLCWNLKKSQVIAKRIIHADYCDSISGLQAEKISYMDSIICIQKEIIFVSNVQNDNSETIIGLKDKKISNMNIIVQEYEGEIKRQKRIKWLAIFGSGIAGAIVILK